MNEGMDNWAIKAQKLAIWFPGKNGVRFTVIKMFNYRPKAR